MVVRTISEIYLAVKGFSSQSGQEIFPLLKSDQTGTGFHPTSYHKGIGGSFPEDKAVGA
jgi:hypothetical protein